VTTTLHDGKTVSAACFTEAIDEWERDMPTVIHRTREELLEQRARLLEEVHMSDAELRERAETYSLSLDELDVWHTIEGLDYLLAGDC
jgi:hypothetical protein